MAIPAKCGTDDLATLLGISVRRVTQVVEKKGASARSSWHIRCLHSVHRFIAHRETVVAQEHGVGAYGKARADARMMRLQREKLEGNLIPEEDAIEGWTRTLAVLKTQFLALPTKSAPYLVQLKTPAQAQNVLTPLVREILETIATVEILPDPTTGAALPSSSVASRASSGSLCRSAWVVIVPHPTPKPCRLELTLPARLQPRRGRLELPAPDGPTN
jgi:hypothetical protein